MLWAPSIQAGLRPLGPFSRGSRDAPGLTPVAALCPPPLTLLGSCSPPSVSLLKLTLEPDGCLLRPYALW